MPFSDSFASAHRASGSCAAIFARELERGVAQLRARHHGSSAAEPVRLRAP